MFDDLEAMRRDAEKIKTRSGGVSFRRKGGAGNAVFSDEQLRDCMARGMRQIDIARKFGVSSPAVFYRQKKLRKAA